MVYPFLHYTPNITKKNKKLGFSNSNHQKNVSYVFLYVLTVALAPAFSRHAIALQKLRPHGFSFFYAVVF